MSPIEVNLAVQKIAKCLKPGITRKQTIFAMSWSTKPKSWITSLKLFFAVINVKQMKQKCVQDDKTLLEELNFLTRAQKEISLGLCVLKWMKNNQRLTTSWPQFTGKHTQRNSIRLPTGSVYANFNNSPDGHVPFTRLQSESPRWDSPWNFLL